MIATQNHRPPIALLAFLSAASSLAMSICVPALPGIKEAFSVEHSTVQLAISAFLLGLALFQPIHGPLCDQFGRRHVLIAGFSLAAGASWGLAFTQGPFSLISLRFVQAAGLAVGTVGSRAMVRDTHDPLAAARILSILASTTAIAPALAPPVGGLLVDLSTWRSVFAFTGAVVSILLVWAVLALPESLPPKRRVVFAPRTLLQAYGSILASRPFLGYSCIFGFGTAAFYAFIAMAPSFFIERLHVGAGAFGLMWTGLSLSYMAGAAIAARFVRRLGAQRLLTGGVALMLGAGVSLPLLLEMIGAKALTIIGPMTILLLGQGLASPLALAGAVETRPDLAGTASGLSSSIGMAISAAVAALAGRLYDGTARPLAFSVMATTIFAALSLILLIAPANARPGPCKPGPGKH